MTTMRLQTSWHYDYVQGGRKRGEGCDSAHSCISLLVLKSAVRIVWLPLGWRYSFLWQEPIRYDVNTLCPLLAHGSDTSSHVQLLTVPSIRACGQQEAHLVGERLVRLRC
mmetsp:Transcript_51876/g.95918  ORF Transcript_51876/g.95918 Transcript_51876/m.95918 type:complete len:110 (+) Transcript_51876:35-364(+)